MAWARMDDGFHDHPKVDGLSLAAVGLWTLCLTWAHRHRRSALIPGHISEARATKVAGRMAPKLAFELVKAGLWEPEENIGGWVIHDFADYLPKERDPDERREAGRRGAQKRWEAARQDGGKLPSGSMANDGSRASARAFPSRPVPLTTKSTSSADADGAFAEWWALYPRKVGKADARRAWAKAVKASSEQAVLDGLKGQLAGLKASEERFRPHPATWLRQGRWEDERTPAADQPTEGWWNVR